MSLVSLHFLMLICLVNQAYTLDSNTEKKFFHDIENVKDIFMLNESVNQKVPLLFNGTNDKIKFIKNQTNTIMNKILNDLSSTSHQSGNIKFITYCINLMMDYSTPNVLDTLKTEESLTRFINNILVNDFCKNIFFFIIY